MTLNTHLVLFTSRHVTSLHLTSNVHRLALRTPDTPNVGCAQQTNRPDQQTDQQTTDHLSQECALGPAREHPLRRQPEPSAKHGCTGKYETLYAALQVIGHVAAYQLRQRQRFDTYAPWPHAFGPAGQPNPP